MPDINPDEVTKDELIDMAEDEGVDTSGTKADIAERLESLDEAKGYKRAPLPDFDPKNPGGVSFGYGTVDDEAREARAASGQAAPRGDGDEAEGGMSFDYGNVPAERFESGAY